MNQVGIFIFVHFYCESKSFKASYNSLHELWKLNKKTLRCKTKKISLHLKTNNGQIQSAMIYCTLSSGANPLSPVITNILKSKDEKEINT